MAAQITKRDQSTELPQFSEPKYGGKVLKELKLNGQNIIQPWGVEFADSSAFYSLEDGFGYRYELIEHQEYLGHLAHNIKQIIRMHEGLIRLDLAESMVGPREFRRTCTLVCLEDTTLMDFVLRYRFLASRFPRGYIAGRMLPFVGSCIYHQFPVDSANISNDEYSIRVEVVAKKVPSRMLGHVYLRDSEDSWVLHIRMLPLLWDKEVIKLCSKWFATRPLPQWISALLLRLQWVKDAIWYRGERNPWRNRFISFFSPNAFPMVRLKKGEVLMWDAVCHIDPPILEN